MRYGIPLLFLDCNKNVVSKLYIRAGRSNDICILHTSMLHLSWNHAESAQTQAEPFPGLSRSPQHVTESSDLHKQKRIKETTIDSLDPSPLKKSRLKLFTRLCSTKPKRRYAKPSEGWKDLDHLDDTRWRLTATSKSRLTYRACLLCVIFVIVKQIRVNRSCIVPGNKNRRACCYSATFVDQRCFHTYRPYFISARFTFTNTRIIIVR